MTGRIVPGQGATLPGGGLLERAADALQDTQQWAFLLDPQGQLVFISDEARLSFGWDLPLPTALLGTAFMEACLASPFGVNTVESFSGLVERLGGFVLTDIGRAAVEAQADPRLREVLDDLAPSDDVVSSFHVVGTGFARDPVGVRAMVIRLRDRLGAIAGTAAVWKPAPGMASLALLAVHSDPGHLDRMGRVAIAGRRPAAILFADLEGSSPLSRRLPTASYFNLMRRLIRVADRQVVSSGGLVGRHVGDGIAAFFLAETAGSESAAASACITAARAIRDAVPEVAHRSQLDPRDVQVRIGLHWGSTVYVGNITSVGRSEVTALGDEVNEAARIEACGTGGRALASKNLIERLDGDAAAILGIDISGITYVALGELASATEKARSDAPAIAVCEI